jgi:hypothetical protein
MTVRMGCPNGLGGDAPRGAHGRGRGNSGPAAGDARDDARTRLAGLTAAREKLRGTCPRGLPGPRTAPKPGPAQ